MENNIITRYLTYKDDGRLGNQFYYVLQAFINTVPHVHYKYVLRSGQEGSCYYNFIRSLNLNEYITTENEYKECGCGCIKIDSWKQEVYIDYTFDQLNDFIDTTILKSDTYKNMKLNYDELAIHIRNGDYLNSNNFFTCFNRYEYIIRAISYFRDIKTLHVFSDQTDIVKEQFGYMFDLNFNNVIYENGTTEQDFIKLSSFKNKILFNSTFSFWAGFISDRLFNETTKTTVPDPFTKITPMRRRAKERWVII